MFRRKHHSQDVQDNDAVHREAKINELKASIGPLSGRSLEFCDDACMRRYLEARNWNVDKAKKMLEETLKWRSTYKPEDIRWHEVASEGETGKVYRANFQDRKGRTVLVLRPGKQDLNLSRLVLLNYADHQVLSGSQNIPKEFGGKKNVEYDHEEFSRLMAKDETRAANLRESDNPSTNGHSISEVAHDEPSGAASAS